MQYTPMSDEEIESSNLIQDGTKCFVEVMESRDHIGKESGKESIMLKLAIWDGEVIKTHLFVYLTPAYMKLFKHACISMLGQVKYDSGNIQAVNFEGKGCDAIIGIEKGKNGHKDKNIIIDFSPTKKIDEQLNKPPYDNLPF